MKIAKGLWEWQAAELARRGLASPHLEAPHNSHHISSLHRIHMTWHYWVQFFWWYFLLFHSVERASQRGMSAPEGLGEFWWSFSFFFNLLQSWFVCCCRCSRCCLLLSGWKSCILLSRALLYTIRAAVSSKHVTTAYRIFIFFTNCVPSWASFIVVCCCCCLAQ